MRKGPTSHSEAQCRMKRWCGPAAIACRAYRRLLAEHDCAAILLYNPDQYTDTPSTVSNMQVWALHNALRYALIFAEGPGNRLFESLTRTATRLQRTRDRSTRYALAKPGCICIRAETWTARSGLTLGRRDIAECLRANMALANRRLADRQVSTRTAWTLCAARICEHRGRPWRSL